MSQQTVQTTPDWLLSIASPLMLTPCGEDPRYLDDFQRIKEENDKLRDVDYAMVLATCRNLLTHTTKDLRVAGYLIIAAVYVDGLPGLLEALKAYRTLLDNFWEDCHPHSESGRMAALNMLGNSRIVAFADLHEKQAPADIFKDLKHEVNHIQTFLTEKFGAEAPGLSKLVPWVEERVRRVENITSDPEDPFKPITEKAVAEPTIAPIQTVTSEQQLEQLTRKIHHYLMDSGDLLRALAYSRAFRWGNLPLPPHENNRTRIPSPRVSGLAELENTLRSEGLISSLACCENLFFEPGFHLLFDLQLKIVQFLESNQRPELSRMIQNGLNELLERHPLLLELEFDDGTPFATSECRQWIQQGGGIDMNTATKRFEEELDDPTMTGLIDKAIKLAKRKKLPEALQALHTMPENTELQRIKKNLVQARLCLAAGKAQTADVILDEAHKSIVARHLAVWKPNLAIEIMQQQLTALQSLKKGSSIESKQRIEKKWHEVWRLLCKIDVASASFFNPI